MTTTAQVTTTDYALVGESTSRRNVTLGCCIAVFLAQYAQSSPAIAPFLANSPVGILIGTDATGVIFAAYPLATALATPLPSVLIAACGVRSTVMLGLVLTSCGSLAFGLVGTATHCFSSAAVTIAALVLARALGGVGAALAEAGCLTAVSTAAWGDDMGKALSTIEVTTGVGAAMGAAMGGALYELGAFTWFGAFLLPLLVGCPAAHMHTHTHMHAHTCSDVAMPHSVHGLMRTRSSCACTMRMDASTQPYINTPRFVRRSRCARCRLPPPS